MVLFVVFLIFKCTLFLYGAKHAPNNRIDARNVVFVVSNQRLDFGCGANLCRSHI